MTHALDFYAALPFAAPQRTGGLPMVVDYMWHALHRRVLEIVVGES